MKTFQLLPFFVVCILNKVNAQELPEGKFVYSNGFTSQEIIIEAGNRFSYAVSSCTYERSGNGTYTFQSGKLSFLFKAPPTHSLHQPSVIFEATEGDSTWVNLNFFSIDDSMYAFPFVSVKIAGTKLGTQSNENGAAVLRILNSTLPITLEISSAGIHPDEIRIEKKGNYTIAFPLRAGREMKPYAEGDKVVFDVADLDEERIVLKDESGRESLLFDKK